MSEKEKKLSTTEEENVEKVTAPEKKERKKSRFNVRSFKYGTMSVVLTIVFIVAVVLVNVIVGLVSERFDTTADLSEFGIYTLSEQTSDYLEGQLDSEVSVTVLSTESDFEAQGSHYKQINEILKNMELTGGNITLDYLDLDQNPNYTSKFKGETLEANYIVVESEKTGRHRIISPYEYFSFNEEYMYYGSYVVEGSNIEQAAISAIMYVSNDDLVRVAFTEGFSEGDSTALQMLLKQNGYEVDTINLSTISEVDPDIDFVVMFGPRLDVDNEHLTKLDRFLDNNGAFGKNVFYFASAQQPETPNIDAFLADWGMKVEYSVVGQTNENYLISNYTLYAHLQQLLDTDYAGTAYGSTLYTFGADIRPVTQLWEGGARGGVEQEILMTSYDDAFIYPLSDTENKDFEIDSAESGTYNDAIVAYRIHSDTQALSRVAVFGSEQLAGSSFMSLSNANNADFFINMFNFISGKEDSITVKSKSFSSTTFDMSAQTANTLAVILCIVIPVIVIVLGIVIWVRRRHR